MDSFAATRAMVAECADMVLRLDAAPGSAAPTDVPCVRFNMIAACDVVRFVFEDAAPPKEDGKYVVPLPGVPRDTVQLAVDLLHSITTFAALSKDECTRALQGMDVLGSRVLVPLLLGRLWHWLAHEPLDQLLPHAGRLLADRAVQSRVMRRLVALQPLWDDFRTAVLDKLTLDFETAKVVLYHLVRFYHASTVLAAVLERLQHPTADKVLALCSEHGSFYHPGEVRDVMTTLRAALTPAAANTRTGHPVAALAGTVLGALGTYRTLPMTTAKVHGSIVQFESPTASVLLTFDTESARPVFVRASNWLRVNVDRESGTMDVSFMLGRLDDEGSSTRTQLRITCWSTANPVPLRSEVWFRFSNVDPRAWTSLASGARVCGQDARQKLALQAAYRLRLDFFFDPVQDVLETPF